MALPSTGRLSPVPRAQCATHCLLLLLQRQENSWGWQEGRAALQGGLLTVHSAVFRVKCRIFSLTQAVQSVCTLQMAQCHSYGHEKNHAHSLGRTREKKAVCYDLGFI